MVRESSIVLTCFVLSTLVLEMMCKETKETCVGDACVSSGRSVLQIIKQNFDADQTVEDEEQGKDNNEGVSSKESSSKLRCGPNCGGRGAGEGQQRGSEFKGER